MVAALDNAIVLGSVWSGEVALYPIVGAEVVERLGVEFPSPIGAQRA
jgi:hypothetical protein